MRVSGHGHVIANTHGLRARCGGPALCRACARELADSIQERARQRNDVLTWCIYEKPLDYPRNFVVRPFSTQRGPYLTALIANDLTEARSLVPEGLARIRRFETDDPPIVECWM